MLNLRIAALAASLTMAIPVFAQTDQYNKTTSTTTTTVTTTQSMTTQDTDDAYMHAANMLSDPNVHWTIKEENALLVGAPYVRPSDTWELNHMFRSMSGNDERVILTAITNTIHENAGDYYTRRAAEMAYWHNLYSNPATAYTPNPFDNTREQSMVSSGTIVNTGLSEYSAWELMQKDLNAQDRTTFRMLWDGMTSGQQQALVDISRQSHYYFTSRSADIY